jgi:hypothetical protein
MADLLSASVSEAPFIQEIRMEDNRGRAGTANLNE